MTRNELDEHVRFFNRVLGETCDEFSTLQVVKPRDPIINLWFTSELRDERKQVASLGRKAVKSKSQEDWDKFHEELGEFEQALKHESKARQQAEIGDLLFTVVNLARWYGLDPSAALQGTNERFVRRFAQVEAAAGESLEGYSIEELERFWQAAKANDSLKSEE